eukprot:Gregarina_sp_Poly_1__7542@NODE_421_length_8662_cov_273_710646_g343_i0_p1_GENE_NODE_421_length_8662_cov_273_710646_g343_i0NODE_421_length_8662_cov_273_710646_g343_i0_p1_ORF_typecomplete_len1723_score238_68Myosin_head/PF00063_21/5_6e179Myosin_N/PF02736_19/0_0005TniB/PF05621_11/0_017AAA_22/PF13401_6/0_066AAA_22/PF13401_6/5_5e03AAA_22/PF13401_6/1_3e04IQ/PF00612_27/0_011IQ/PF00612_27/12RuvB_N/PF05496_12/0_31ABC_tran/PF00005_27/0_71ABC_tran/PF00005_27/3_3e03KASH_CCD/PF14662_6/0_67AAA_16/PF13191_6/1_2A
MSALCQVESPGSNCAFDRSLYHSQVWVEHPSLGFAPGQIVKEEPGSDGEVVVVVEACDGRICRVNKSSCSPVHPNSLQGVPDLLELGEFSLAALLHNIRVRWEKGEYYSSIGLPILISVNPYKPLPHLYDSATRKMYQSAQFLLSSPPSSARGSSSGKSKTEHGTSGVEGNKQAPLLFIDHPHLFGTAQMTYTSLVNNNQAQSIVVSGESGAGKTEATKILLRYFSELDDALMGHVRSPVKTSPFTPNRLSGSLLRSPRGVGFANRMEETPVELHALRSNPILEAFGNAKTLRNDNSSRFGKFIQIWFERRNLKRIRSARISHYLLEKCRLVSLHAHERNYHVFYALVYGAQSTHADKLRRWGIDIASGTKLKILGNDHREALNPIKETETFEELETCLMSTGFSPEEVDLIFSLVAAIMLLFEVQFRTVEGQAAQRAACSGQQPIIMLASPRVVLEKVIELLQIDKVPRESRGAAPFDAVMELFQYKVIHDREKAGRWIYAQRDVAAATHVRDAIIKEFYSRLFDWLVKKINKTLCFKEEAEKERSLADQATRKMSSILGDLPMQYNGANRSFSKCTPRDGSSPAIGLLDIYGFEVFEGRNSFEQLCINFANEKLQQHFNHHVLSLEQKIYHNEGIDWSDILFTDNQHVIDALENSVYGVFVLLDSGCVLKGTDSWVLQEIERQGRKDVVFTPSVKNFKPRSFVVKHYAGIVEYNIDGFVEKNQDRLSSECTYFFQKATSNPLVQQLFSVESIAPPRRYNLTATVSQSFRCQLDDLLASLTKTTPTYVRCIKPNGDKSPHKFESIDCLRQLKYAGLLESIRIRNSGFGVRCTFDEFLDKYAILKKEVLASWHKCCRTDPSARTAKAAWCRDILSSVLPSTTELLQRRSRLISGRLPSPKAVPKRAWQLGQTRVFMKEEVQIHLEKERAAKFRQVVVRIQANYRGFMARMAYQELLRCVVVVQSTIRMHFARVQLKELQERKERETRAANNMKRLWKGARCRQRFLQLRRSAKVVGDWYRFHLWLQFWRDHLAQQIASEEAISSGESGVNAPPAEEATTDPKRADGEIEPASLETASSFPKKVEPTRKASESDTHRAQRSRYSQALPTAHSASSIESDDGLSEWHHKERSSRKSRRSFKQKEAKSEKHRALWQLRNGQLKVPDFPAVVPSRERRREDVNLSEMTKMVISLVQKKDRVAAEATKLREDNMRLHQIISDKEEAEDKLIIEKNKLQDHITKLYQKCIEIEQKARESLDIMSLKISALQETRMQYAQIFHRLNDLRAEGYLNQGASCHDIAELFRIIAMCCNDAREVAAREDLFMQKHLPIASYVDNDFWEGPFLAAGSQNISLPPLSSSSGFSGLQACPGSARHMFHYPSTSPDPYWKEDYYGLGRGCYAHLPPNSALVGSDHELLHPVASAMGRVLGGGNSNLRPCDQSVGSAARTSFAGNSPGDLYGRHSKRFLTPSGCVDLSSLGSNRGRQDPYSLESNSQSLDSPRTKCHERGQSCTVDTAKGFREFPHHRPHQLSADDCENATCVCMPGITPDSTLTYRRMNHHSLQRTPGSGFPSKPPKSARQTPTHRASASLRLSTNPRVSGEVESTLSQAAEEMRSGGLRVPPLRPQARRSKYEVGSDTGSCKAVGPAGSPSSRATQTAAPYMQMGGRPLASGDTTSVSSSKGNRPSVVQRSGVHGAALAEFEDDSTPDIGVQTSRIPFFQYLPSND